MTLSKPSYQPVAGGETHSFPPDHSVPHERRRKRHRQAAVLSGLLVSASILILVLAFKRHPEWKVPVGYFDTSTSSSASDASTVHPDPYDTLPQIDWSWSKPDKTSWWSSTGRQPKVGTQEWLRRYPDFVHGPTPRQSWLVRYQAALAQGLIPDLPKAELVGGLANYPDTLPIDARLCSYRRAGCTADHDIVRGPSSTWAVNFDDGPLPPSAALYKFLDAQHEKATHFWVGNNVKSNLPLALEAAERGDHLAVHTWSHPHLTTYTNEEVIGELGWTMQIIYDISSHLPKYYRPPFGDVDNRVRAIATHVFNMTAVMWNYDSFDWSLNQTWASGDYVDAPMTWLTTQLSTERLTDRMKENDPVNGEGVIVLEHELSFESIQAFTDSYPQLGEKKWRSGTVPDLLQLPWYQ